MFVCSFRVCVLNRNCNSYTLKPTLLPPAAPALNVDQYDCTLILFFRALILEFSVYNAQTNLFALVTCVAEFIGGGIRPWYRINAVSLFSDYTGNGLIVLIADILFVVATFYYTINLFAALKKEGCQNFW